MHYDLLFLRDGMRLVTHRESPAVWSARERDPDGAFALREGVEIPMAGVLAMYPPPPDDEDDAPFPAEVVEAAAVKPAKPKKKGG
jgi:hypothetical protein